MDNKQFAKELEKLISKTKSLFVKAKPVKRNIGWK